MILGLVHDSTTAMQSGSCTNTSSSSLSFLLTSDLAFSKRIEPLGETLDGSGLVVSSEVVFLFGLVSALTGSGLLVLKKKQQLVVDPGSPELS